MADEELKKAFQDLQFKTNESRQRIALGEATKKNLAQKKRVSELAQISIGEFGDDQSMYKCVGRMFVLSSKSEEINEYADEAKEMSEKVDAIDKQKQYLERQMEESERNLREMVQARRG